MQLLYKCLFSFGLTLISNSFASTNGAAYAGESTAVTEPAHLNNQTEYNFNDLVKKADAALDNNNWQPVLADLANFENFKGNNEEAKILESIKRQANYPEANKTEDYKQSDEFHQDQQKIRKAAFSSQVKTNTVNVLTKQQQVENYLANSQLRFASEELKTEIKNNLLSQPTWPGTEVVKTLEQFYWNLDKDTKFFKCSHSLNWQDFINFRSRYGDLYYSLRFLLPVFQAFPTPETRAEFMHFTNPYTQGLSLTDQAGALSKLLPVFQAFPSTETRAEFMHFTNPYTQRLSLTDQAAALSKLLPVFQAFPSTETRAEFMHFTNPYTQRLSLTDQAGALSILLPVFQAFPSPESRAELLEFAQPYMQGLRTYHLAGALSILLPVFQAFPSPESRAELLEFAQPYVKELSILDQAIALSILRPVFQAFPSTESRAELLEFAQPYMQGLQTYHLAGALSTLLPVFQAFPSPESRAELLEFAQPYTQGLALQDQARTLSKLLPVFQTFPTDSELKFNFRSFTNLHKERLQQNYARFAKYLPFSFIDRNYLNYMRVLAALGAEPNASAARMQQVYETSLENLLPAYYAQDPLMQELRTAAGVANAHDFDAIYSAEFEILREKVDNSGYQNQPSTHVYTIYNGQNTLNNYKTNSEAEDFLKHLDSEFLASTPEISVNGTKYKAKEIINLVKQILGLQPKASTTSGGFAHYLGSTMLYAKPDSPKVDEVLGRVWFLINNIISEKFIADAAAANDAETLKKMHNDRNANCRSVVLAILEAAELSNTNAQTHCQTRLTGELLKLTSWHLEHSKLRKLIAHDDSLEVNSDADIRMRIKASPAKADSLFKAIHTTSPNVKKLWEKHLTLGSKPELFELEMTYYDDLYGRTPVLNAAGALQFTPNGHIDYKKDEHILERDDLGNLVKKYNADGSLRRNAMGAEEPEIVYYQAEFAVLEHEFTKRMKAEFEDQRGLVY